MTTDREASPGTQDPSSGTERTATDPRRRAALARLGRAAACSVPATMSLMMMTRSARAS